jgi:anti-sigma-K factor RskA
MGRNHTEMQELVAAYAINALEPDEVGAVDAHLAECPRCRAELRDHRDTAAMLAHAGAEAPTGLWDRIAANLEEEPPDLARIFRMPTSSEKQARFSGAKWRRAAFAAAAVAAGLIAIDTAVIVNGHNDGPDQVEKLLALPDSKLISLRSADGRQAIDAVLTADGRGYVLHGKLAALDSQHTYQLWGIVNGKAPISLGVLGREPKEASFTANTPLNVLAITIEKAGGATAPTMTPLLSGTVA